ncbi:hypothetical protein HMPREF1984_02220 [Leptotrichia sp. oral taxon 215 str. W9775]|nr:hypothetical protein HMPREF1984_02220 [Leptotrichia sp. oral taxon 215 str. W9775]
MYFPPYRPSSVFVSEKAVSVYTVLNSFKKYLYLKFIYCIKIFFKTV